MISLEHPKAAPIGEICQDKLVPAKGSLNLVAWMPLIILPVTAILLVNPLKPWVFMWTISFALFFGCKWLTWW